MVNYLDDLGYHPDRYAARIQVSGCSGFDYGNVVFAVGGRVSATPYTFPSQDPSDIERRGVICSVNTGFLGNWRACSTHLDNSAWAQLQEQDLYDAAAFGGCVLSIYGGDFNLEPGASDFNKWRTDYDEIDEFSPWIDTTDDGRKIDYLWARDCGAVSSPYSVVVSPRPESDHHYYSGRFRLTF